MYKCNKCGFETIEENKMCPLCESLMTKTSDNDIHKTNYSDPDTIKNSGSDITFCYYCYKCKKYSQKKVCMDCNIIGYLSINYKQKHYILNRISQLSEVFNDYEIDDILKNTSDEEKNYIYHNLQDSSRFFYRQDKSKSYTSYFFAVVLYILGFIISTSSFDQELIITYIANSFSNIFLVMLGFMGYWYSKNAYELEESKAVGTFATIGVVISFIYIALSLILSLSFIQGFLVSLGFMFLNIVVNYVYYKKVRNS